MKATIKTLTERGIEFRGHKDTVEISIDGKEVFKVHDGPPEDATLGRNFNDCYSIGNLMKQAYKAGVNGEVLEIENTDVDVL